MVKMVFEDEGDKEKKEEKPVPKPKPVPKKEEEKPVSKPKPKTTRAKPKALPANVTWHEEIKDTGERNALVLSLALFVNTRMRSRHKLMSSERATWETALRLLVKLEPVMARERYSEMISELDERDKAGK